MLDNVDGTPSSAPNWNPPAHLEARFTKKRRRNGSHSPSSHPLTNSHLATTRRQTLLETRKSLLRQRALHVEKVRRSRANSHEAVSERLMALQQSMTQAQKSRNAILAKIAGSCASEVAKAKRLAQEMKLKREEEAKMLRSGVEERMLEAERRREEMLRERRGKRRERGSSSSIKVDGSDDDVTGALQTVRLNVKSEEVIKEEAAKCIQKAYRNYRNREVVKKFVELGLTIESVSEQTFEEVSCLFQEERVQKATARLLKLCGLLEDGQEGGVEKDCRTFLSAYLILGHPAEVLSNDGENEKALITKSKDLLIAFESFLSSPTFPHTPLLAMAWSAFSSAFTSWKAKDSAILINTMVAQYAELELIWQKVKEDIVEHVALEFKEGIREHQLMLLVRIRRLAGERTRTLIRSAVKEACRTRLPKKQKGDTKPRAAPSADSSSVSTNVEASVSSSLENRQQGSSPQIVQTKSADVSGKSFQSLLTDAGMMSNRQIVHELALDREFKLQIRKKSELEKAVEEQARRAFWDTMREDVLQRGELAKWIPGMAESVKGRLLRLLDPNGSLYGYINDSIDIQLIEQQCHAGVYDYEKFFRFVLDILPRICSPARDEDVQTLVNDTGDYIQRLQKLLDVLELLQLDHANFLLMMSAPHVIPEAIPYERHLFAADLEAGQTGLEKTRRWLDKAREEKKEEARNRDPAGNGGVHNTPSAGEIYSYAFVGLTMSLTGLNAEDIPETFHLDIDRIFTIREEFRNIIVGASITLTIKNLLRRDIRSAWSALKDRLLPLLEAKKSTTELTADMVAFVQETVAIPPTVQNHISAAVSRIARPGACETDPVVRVMARRLKEFVSARLNAESAKERVRLVAGGGETLGSLGMAEWIGEVGRVVEKVGGLAVLNRECYAGWYDEILGVRK